VGEVWEECLEHNSDDAPGQEDVIQLLAQLYFSNLLYYEMPADSAKLFERFKLRKQRELKSKLLSIMFIRIPLFDPEHILKRFAPLFRLLINQWGALLWLAVVALSLKIVIDRFDEVTTQAQGILAPDNLVFLYLGLILIKTMHEFGHAAVCNRFGGEVHTMGVMLLVFTPLPYMDATSSWSFRSRWHRALVGGAGMIVEVFAAAVATVVWAYTGPGIIHSLAYNMMFIASVSTVLFNANPLLRFDGYYILSDLLDIPNLHTRSNMHLRHLVEHYAFGYRDSYSPAQSTKEASWLTVFGILSSIYKVVVFTGIILFVADRFLIAGLIMALICVISWGLVPLFRLNNYLLTSPRLARTRPRAIGVSVGTILLLIFLLAIWPFPNRFRAPGVREASQYIKVVNEAPGYLETILVPTGVEVTQGMPLLELSDRQLDLEIGAAHAQRNETLALKTRAMRFQAADLEPLNKRLEAIEKKIKNLEEQKEALVVRAREKGVWVSPRSKDMLGAWVLRGSDLGMIINHEAFRFSAVVSQDEASNLFEEQIRKAEVRLHGQSSSNLQVKDFEIIPFQHERLPSAALGWSGGGDVAVSVTDQTGLKTVEPFFHISADVNLRPEVLFLHGRSGKIRFSMEPEPLFVQWFRKLRQLLQKRYQI